MGDASGLVKGLKRRLSEVDDLRAKVATQISELESRARLLNEEQAHLRALLATYDERDDADTAPSVRRMADTEAEAIDTVNSGELSSWAETATEIIRNEGRPVHYRLLHDKLRALGHLFGGQNPPATFLSLLVREKAFMRAGRGSYWLADQPLPANPFPEPRPVVATHRVRSIRRARRRVA